jgi:hypothetical protein
MDTFLHKYLSLTNKNLIMVISIGNSVSSNIFNKQLDKDIINNVIYKIQNTKGYKYKISHTPGIKEYKYNNTVYYKYNTDLEHNIYNNIDTFQTNELHFEVIQIQKDNFIPPSICNFSHIENYDMMTININNSIDINICDYNSYYTVNITLKKPVLNTLLKTVINSLSI